MTTNPDHMAMLGGLAATLQRGGASAQAIAGYDGQPDVIAISVTINNERRVYWLAVQYWAPTEAEQ